MELPFQLDLNGKTVVVTGGGGVLCGMFAKALGQCNAKIAILDLRLEAAEAVAAEINSNGGVAKGYAANVLKKEELEACRAQIEADFGSCDILINGRAATIPKARPRRNILRKAIWTRKKTLSPFLI